MPITPPPSGGSGGGTVVFQDEGSAVGTAAILNFVGAGVSATHSGGTVTATISGGTAAGSIVFLDEGTVAGTATHFNTVGSGGTVSYSGGTATLTLSASGSGVTFNPSDIEPAAPDADDDEFDATDTSDPITGWTTLGTLDGLNTNSTVASHLYLKKNATNTTRIDGIYKAMSAPFTVTAKMSDLRASANYMRAGIFIGLASPGDIETLGVVNAGSGSVNPWSVEALDMTNPTSFSGTVNATAIPWIMMPIYLRIIVASTTDVTYQYSLGGRYFFSTVANRNPGFTIGSVGLFVNPQHVSNDMEAIFDWIRFT